MSPCGHTLRRTLVVIAALLALAAVAPATAAAAPPAGVTGIALDGAAELAWQPAAGATAYTVYRGTTPSTITTAVTPVGGVAATGFTDTTAVNGTTYYYAVRAIVAGAESASSLTAQVTPRARSCASGGVVVLENCYPGNSDWRVTGAAAASAGGIEAFATASSINKSESVDLKVDAKTATTFHVDVYRSGYYGGAGARLYSELRGIAATNQPACANDSQTGRLDCSNWSTSATLTTTGSWPSGIYLLRLVRDDNGADTHVVVIVRDDARASSLLYGAAVSTWQAYNNYGGRSLYTYNSTGAATVSGTARAVKVSFDRPYAQPRDSASINWYPRAEYPTVYWLEREGFDVGYIADTDLETRAIGTHQAYMSAAHDEYWSSAIRSAVQTARDAGTDIFFSGSNASYWRIRFENGPNGGANRIEVCYKTVESGGADPSGPTTTWRDPAALNQPENALIGQQYVGDKDGVYFPLVVSALEGTDREWRFTGLDAPVSGSSTSIGTGLVGWEWDQRQANGFEPTGVKTLATSSVTGNLVQGNGSGYTTGSTSSNVTKYTAGSGALVFATGTNHWAWGLGVNADGAGEPDRRIQQATTNVLEDMGVPPATPSANITVDSATAPRVSATSPADGASQVALATSVQATFSRAMDASTITSTSFTLKRPDGTSVPAAVAYDAASGKATLTPNAALATSTTYTARVDTTVKASDGTPLQTAAMWTFTTKPPTNPVRVNAGGAAYTTADGRSFAADQYFSGGSTNTTAKTITGTSDQALYQNERWGQFDYAIPVVNGQYDVTFHFVELYYGTVVAGCAGKRIFSMDVLDTPTNPDLANIDICATVGSNAALQRTVYGVNVTDGFLNVHSVYGSADDPEVAAIEVVPSTGPPPAPTVASKTPADASTAVATTVKPTATFSRAMDASTITSSSFTLAKPDGTTVPATVAYDATTATATLTPGSALANSTTYTATVTTAAKASDGTALATPATWSFTTAATTPVGTTIRINAGGAAYTSSSGAVFSADQSFTGGSTNASTSAITGTTDPALYKDERWGQFSYAIAIANGTYDVKLHFVELYYGTIVPGSCIGKRIFGIDIGNTPASPDIANLDVCAAAGGANTALVKTVTGVQVSGGTLNIQSVYGSADDPEVAAIEVVPSSAPTGPPTVTAKTPADASTGVATTVKPTATFSRGMDGTTITSSSFTLTAQGSTTPIAATVAYDGASTTATLTPSAALALSTTYTAKLDTTIKASDGTPLASAVTWSFTTGASNPALSTVRINTGGPAYTAADGRTFLADQYFTGGSTLASTSAITGTTDPALYQNERWGQFTYSIPVVNGTYDVKLHFVELYYAAPCSGKRIFSMDALDTTTSPDVSNLDICAQVGAKAALVKTLTGITVNDGFLDLKSVYGSVDDPEIAAIEVVPSNGAPPPPPPDPSTVGSWSAPASWPIVAVHASLLPTGNVLAWDGFAAAPNSQRIWNPTTGTFTPVPYGVNIFCSGHVNLPDGRVFIAGGHQAADVGIPDTTIYDPSAGTWTAAPNMTVGRWYPTATELGNGKVLVFSGDNIVQNRAGQPPPFSDASVNSLPEVYDPVSNSWKDLTNATLTSPLYPFMFTLADGRVFDAGPDTTSRILDPATGTWSTVGTSPFDGMSAVMYRPGKIMKSGSWADPDFNGTSAYNATNATAVIDMNAATPAWRSTAPMAFSRAYHNLTLLPDGTVLASGGMTGSDGVDLTKAVLPAEIWNPTTETWTTVASLQNGREYHSTALLLPDGRVLMAGGGQLPGSTAVNQTNAEIYSPPYLFKGTRPTISAAPDTVQYGQSFTVSTPDAASVANVALIRTPSVTHAFDENQRYIPVSFTAGSGSLTVTPPANANVAPPGYYMLFIVNGNGVPSVASMVRFPAPWEDSQAPTAPTALTATGGIGQVALSWTGSTDNVGVAKYDVYRSTTTGFTPSLSNRIAQSATTSYTDSGLAAGTYYYVVKAEDAAGNLSGGSNEASAASTADGTAPAVSITAPADGATVSGTTTVSANASDNVGVAGVQFKLDGANLGAEDTASPYAVSWNTTQATNASHTLTAVARDAAGNTTTSTVVTVTVSNTAPPPPTGLVAAYSFDAGSGTTVADTSGNSNTGTISAATWTTAGHTGSALSFNGTSASVSVPDSPSLDLTTGMTLEAWVNPTALGTVWRTAVMKEAPPGALAYALYANTDTTRPSGHVFTSAESILKGTAALTLSTWAHLATTYDGTTLRLYVNGTQVASKATTGNITVTNGAVKIGGNSIWGEYFKGTIDDVRIYNRALTATEVQSDMNRAVSSTALASFAFGGFLAPAQQPTGTQLALPWGGTLGS